MMSGMEHVYLGLILVGVGLTFKVVSDGLREVNEFKGKLTQYRAASEQCHLKTVDVDTKSQKVEALVSDLKSEVKTLDEKARSVDLRVRSLKKKLERGKRKKMRVDL